MIKKCNNSPNSLLVLSDYPTMLGRHHGGIFVKKQVDLISYYFSSIYIVSPKPIYLFRGYKSYAYRNIHVFYPRFFPLPPIDYFRKLRGDYLSWIVSSFLSRKKLCPIIIHSHFIWPYGYVGALIKNRRGLPLVITALSLIHI